MTRTCDRCGKDIPSTRRADALYCTVACGNNVRNKRHYDSHPEEMRKKRWRDNSDVTRRIHSRVKCRAKRSGLDFNLEPTDIIVPDVCPVLGIPIFPHSGGQGHHPNSPSLDRINPSQGYVKGNVRVISGRANLLKSNATSAEMALILSDMKALGL